jgi:hypothetical protein
MFMQVQMARCRRDHTIRHLGKSLLLAKTRSKSHPKFEISMLIRVETASHYFNKPLDRV